MTKQQSKSQPTWTDVKAKLAAFDRPALLDLVHDLYAAHKDNQAFLHARFGLGEDVLELYKEIIARGVWPDAFRNQDTSVSKAKQAISDYKKAVGDSAGLTELMVFYCEQAAGYCRDIGYQEEGFFDALVRMFGQALKSANTLPADGQDSHIARLDHVREISHDFGYGVGDDMDYLLQRTRAYQSAAYSPEWATAGATRSACRRGSAIAAQGSTPANESRSPHVSGPGRDALFTAPASRPPRSRLWVCWDR